MVASTSGAGLHASTSGAELHRRAARRMRSSTFHGLSGLHRRMGRRSYED